ncbi:glyoxalase/bleomycin resistance/dioxygenase family protein [Pseudomonas sp. CrR25]|nr:glyoxalase/bleomycin resistance/dioxygenase family protein [Pseudomonas sp. CrR25]
MILAFAHPGLVVDDLDKARAFYQAMFGFKVIATEGWANNPQVGKAIGCPGAAADSLMLAGHNCFLELFQYHAPLANGPAPAALLAHQPGIRHLAFYVSDCRGEYRRLLALGGQPLGEPVDLGDNCYAVYARDPFGNILELCEIPSPAEQPTLLPGISCLDSFGLPDQ